MANEKGTEEDLGKLSAYEKNLQMYSQQKQQFQMQLIEVESALKELDTAKESYRIIGNIMVNSSVDELKKELSEKQEMFSLRIKSLEKQESKIKDNVQELQKKVMEGLKVDKDGTND